MLSNDRPIASTSRRGFLGKVALGAAALTVSGASITHASDDQPTREEVTIHENITYATRDAGEQQTAGELKLDLYLPNHEGPLPLIVFIHGGGWLVNTRKNTPDLERYFASKGYAMASIDHRLSYIPEGIQPIIQPRPDNPTPRGKFPDHIVDVKAAIRWLRAHADEYGLDPKRIATWGSSSGSHLAALAGTMGEIEEVEGNLYDIEPTVYPDESGRVQAVVGWYTPTDFLLMDEQADELGLFNHEARNSPESLLVGGDINKNALAVRRADPLTYLDVDDPPFLLMHGRQDGTVPYEQSEVLFEKLSDVCIDSTFYVLDRLSHGFGFEELKATSASNQTVRETGRCNPGSEPKGRAGEHPLAGPAAIEQFLNRTIGRERRRNDDPPSDDSAADDGKAKTGDGEDSAADDGDNASDGGNGKAKMGDT
jgi:acetyl esterase/lipase